MDLTELIQSVDIVEYISQFVDLELKGDEWWGLSCFKEEKTPSFSVRRDPPVFYDYSSGVGGNLFSFVKQYYHCSSSKAVDIIKQYAGVDGDISDPHGRMAAIDVCNKYKPKIHNHKPSAGIILPDNYMDRYLKDYSKLQVWANEGISMESLDRFQVYYDDFSNRLVYPIRDLEGKIVNIGGRTLDSNWKELGQRKYCYFYPWGFISVIYGLFDNMQFIKQKHEVIIFEGCKSVYLADTWGIHNTGAILTSHLSEYQMKLLVQLGCDVVFALDKEINIRNDKNIQKLKRYVNVFYFWDKNNLFDDKDAPVDKGKDAFMELYNGKLRLR